MKYIYRKNKIFQIIPKIKILEIPKNHVTKNTEHHGFGFGIGNINPTPSQMHSIEAF